MNAKRIGWTVLCGLLVLGSAAMGQSLGVGRGVDHVASLVRLENFDPMVNVLTQQLGFSATATLVSPAGAKNRLIWFDDLSYLEVDAFTELNDFTAPFLDFLAHHEGAKFYGTEVLDAAQASTFLTHAGYANTGPIPASPLTVESTGQIVGTTPLWSLVILLSPLAPDNSNFFLDYDEAQVQQMFVQVPALAPRPHPNTAKKIHTLWLVVSNLDSAIAFYEGLGLEVHSRHEKIDYLGARAATVRYPHGSTVTLLEPEGPGLAADFAADRGEGILGVSIEVGSLHTARALIQGNTGLPLPVFEYRGQERFLIPASLTHGVLIEMVEESDRGR
jgi:catechol 2,3-dioxygenase-like lactoylglutathione lyase family enzyme